MAIRFVLKQAKVLVFNFKAIYYYAKYRSVIQFKYPMAAT